MRIRKLMRTPRPHASFGKVKRSFSIYGYLFIQSSTAYIRTLFLPMEVVKIDPDEQV